MQKLIDEDRRETFVIKYHRLHFRSCDGYIEQTAFLTVGELITLCQHMVKNGVVAHHRRKSVGIFITLQKNHIVCFQSFRFVDGQKFDFPVAYEIVEASVFIDALIGTREIIIIKRIAPQQENGLVGRNCFDQLSDNLTIFASLISIEE